MKMRVEMVKVSEVQVSEELNLRKDYGDLEPLKQSIGAQGLIDPVIVRALKRGGYMLVAGFRRMRCIVELGLAEVPAKIMAANTTIAEALLVNFSENVSRKDLNPVEEAEAVDRLEKEGLVKDEVCKQLGWSTQMYATRKKLGKVSDQLKDAIRLGRISAQQAMQIDRLPVEMHDVWIGIAERKSLAELREMIDKKLDPTPAPTPGEGGTGEPDPEAEALREQRNATRRALRDVCKALKLDLDVAKQVKLEEMGNESLEAVEVLMLKVLEVLRDAGVVKADAEKGA